MYEVTLYGGEGHYKVQLQQRSAALRQQLLISFANNSSASISNDYLLAKRSETDTQCYRVWLFLLYAVIDQTERGGRETKQDSSPNNGS